MLGSPLGSKKAVLNGSERIIFTTVGTPQHFMPFGPPTSGRPTSEAKTLLNVFILKVLFPAKRKFPFGIYAVAPPVVVNPGNTLLTFKMDIVHSGRAPLVREI